LSGDGKWVAYHLDVWDDDSLTNDQWYIADASGATPPQRLYEYEYGQKEIHITDISIVGMRLLLLLQLAKSISGIKSQEV